MLTRKYTNSEIKLLLSSIVIIIDSREKVNAHITKEFDKMNIKYIVRKLQFADYSFYLPKNEALDIMDDISFENNVSIERKANANELAGNYSTTRKQFENEHQRHQGKMILMIEDDTYSDIQRHNYRSKLKPDPFTASMHSWQHKYDVPFIFIEKQYSAEYIYNTFKYWLRAYLETHK